MGSVSTVDAELSRLSVSCLSFGKLYFQNTCSYHLTPNVVGTINISHDPFGVCDRCGNIPSSMSYVSNFACLF